MFSYIVCIVEEFSDVSVAYHCRCDVKVEACECEAACIENVL